MFFGEGIDLLNDSNVLLKRANKLKQGELFDDLEEFLVKKEIALKTTCFVVLVDLSEVLHIINVIFNINFSFCCYYLSMNIDDY